VLKAGLRRGRERKAGELEMRFLRKEEEVSERPGRHFTGTQKEKG
jgi:hypothetical protein